MCALLFGCKDTKPSKPLPEISRYRVFYCCYSTDRSVESNAPVPMGQEDLPGLASQVLSGPKDFLGIMDARRGILQFMMGEGGRIWMEIPSAEKNGSYGTHVTAAELGAILQALPEIFRPEAFPKLEFAAW